eukprot:gnl/MRDRNA2_/MRDRNA2_94912_c0_seq1.p1 gnl/MRDRNA2_/MRDRNA2_94912_c0~~gnl/MRDRNA2_/MRDRNA2_94912_c0_seq1.p1  ORF type:complete len:326 (-),score=101.85 gnl/MRDRNA2_/MRDRNA2_94912_c0_seq1:93-1070(-)
MAKKKKKPIEETLEDMPADIAALQGCIDGGDSPEEEAKPTGKKRKREATKSSEAVTGNKKKKKKKGNEGDVIASDKDASKKADKDEAGADASGEVNSDSYRAAGVVFFTRAKTGSINRVLLALEERKVQAAHLGLGQSGKVSKKVVVFPQGRREKKDKSDPVETAKREYIEETGDFAGFSQHLDVAEFDSDDDAAPPDGIKKKNGSGNIALWFSPASMVVLFCEIPPEAARKESAPREGHNPDLPELANDEKRGNTHSYRVGKMNHVECVWVDIAELRKALASEGKSPSLRTTSGDEYHMFPMNLSILRIPEAKEFLGVPSKSSK